MSIDALLTSFACVCGKTHTCPIEDISIGPGAILRLPALCKDSDRILLIADQNTDRIAGKKVRDLLGDRIKAEVIYPGNPLLIPNEDAIQKANAAISSSSLIIGVGSGVIQDICKYVAHENRLPYIIVATAPSMDGYASSVCAMIFDGMKITTNGNVPKAIIADIDILKNAPIEMIRSGYGDVIGKLSALNDWELAHLLFDEALCPFIYDTVAQMIKKMILAADGLQAREEQSIMALTEALIGVGIMMHFAGCSRPASGSEHHLSHFFEVTGLQQNTPYFPHGLDVAYSTVITAKLREEICTRGIPQSGYSQDAQSYRLDMASIYQGIAEGCIALQQRVGRYEADRFPLYKEKQEDILRILSKAPRAKQVEVLLQKVGIEMADFYAMYDPKKLKNAVNYAKDLKDRYTVLWLYYDLYGKDMPQ